QPSTSDSSPSRSPAPVSGGRGTGTSSRPVRRPAPDSVRSRTVASGGSSSTGRPLWCAASPAVPRRRPAGRVGQVGGAAGVADPHVLQLVARVGAAQLGAVLGGGVVDDG